MVQQQELVEQMQGLTAAAEAAAAAGGYHMCLVLKLVAGCRTARWRCSGIIGSSNAW
jgi:hypothetical protein